MCTQVAPIYWNLPVLAPSSQWILSPPHSTFSHVIWVLEISKCCKAELHHPSRKPVKIDTFLPAHCQNPPLCHSLSLLNTHTHTHTALFICQHWHLSLECLTCEIIGSILTTDFCLGLSHQNTDPCHDSCDSQKMLLPTLDWHLPFLQNLPAPTPH